jgi:hypothetical protein
MRSSLNRGGLKDVEVNAVCRILKETLFQEHKLHVTEGICLKKTFFARPNKASDPRKTSLMVRLQYRSKWRA